MTYAKRRDSNGTSEKTMTTFWVDGIPATKGSWIVTRTRHMRPDNARERPWANAVAWSAKAAGVNLCDGPVRVAIALYYPSPKKPKHAFPARNDVDKTARSCLDALTGIAWHDDQQVVSLSVTKGFADQRGPGAQFHIEAVP